MELNKENQRETEEDLSKEETIKNEQEDPKETNNVIEEPVGEIEEIISEEVKQVSMFEKILL